MVNTQCQDEPRLAEKSSYGNRHRRSTTLTNPSYGIDQGTEA
jgi:hypothetical protein